jgi:predicted LPLAT superfamily acyltransferase
MEMFISSYRLGLEFGKILLDRAMIGILGPERMHVQFDGKEELLKLVKEGKGIIIVAGHVGCWQVAMSALHFINIPVSMHMQKEEGDVDRHYFEHAGMESPYRIIDPWGYLGGALEMVEVLKRGEILCVMGDRLFGNVKNAVEVDFLGEGSLFPFSAYKVASATGAPIVVLFSYKTGANTYELSFERVIRVPEGIGRSGEKFTPYVSQFVESLDAFTKEHPYQFFNFYDMWDRNLK